jgi:hypothetical protein
MVVGVAVTVVAGASVSGGWEREGRRGDRGFERTRADTADRQNPFVPGLGTPGGLYLRLPSHQVGGIEHPVRVVLAVLDDVHCIPHGIQGESASD